VGNAFLFLFVLFCGVMLLLRNSAAGRWHVLCWDDVLLRNSVLLCWGILLVLE